LTVIVFSCCLLCVTSLASTFLFHSSGDHRDLHSFPTRRSSDLAFERVLHVGAGVRGRREASVLAGGEELLQVTDDAGCEAVLAEDRKSTRLNSSHQIISYAVFCLKKKKKNINTNTKSKNTLCHH